MFKFKNKSTRTVSMLPGYKFVLGHLSTLVLVLIPFSKKALLSTP